MPKFKPNTGFKMESPFKQAARNFTPEEANEETKAQQSKAEHEAQQSKAEHEGQQVIGQVNRGEISELEGNKSLSDIQDLQNKPQ